MIIFIFISHQKIVNVLSSRRKRKRNRKLLLYEMNYFCFSLGRTNDVLKIVTSKIERFICENFYLSRKNNTFNIFCIVHNRITLFYRKTNSGNDCLEIKKASCVKIKVDELGFLKFLLDLSFWRRN